MLVWLIGGLEVGILLGYIVDGIKKIIRNFFIRVSWRIEVWVMFRGVFLKLVEVLWVIRDLEFFFFVVFLF